MKHLLLSGNVCYLSTHKRSWSQLCHPSSPQGTLTCGGPRSGRCRTGCFPVWVYEFQLCGASDHQPRVKRVQPPHSSGWHRGRQQPLLHLSRVDKVIAQDLPSCQLLTSFVHVKDEAQEGQIPTESDLPASSSGWIWASAHLPEKGVLVHAPVPLGFHSHLASDALLLLTYL